MSNLQKEDADKLHYELNGGIKIINSEVHLHKYIFDYGKMHQAKLVQSFESIPDLAEIVCNNDIQIIDYGCGQGIGTMVFIDYLKSLSLNKYSISKIFLIEPSELAIKRAALNIYYNIRTISQSVSFLSINKDLNYISYQDISTHSDSVKFHIFSNIIDVPGIDIETLYEKICSTQLGVNYFICVSPKFQKDTVHLRNIKLDAFMKCFQRNYIVDAISCRETNINQYTRFERVFRTNFHLK